MDTATLIEKYLSDKKHLITNADSFNIHNGKIERWEFKNIPMPTEQQLGALLPTVNAEAEAEKAIELKKDAAEERLKNVDFTKITTIAGLKGVVADILEVMK